MKLKVSTILASLSFSHQLFAFTRVTSKLSPDKMRGDNKTFTVNNPKRLGEISETIYLQNGDGISFRVTWFHFNFINSIVEALNSDLRPWNPYRPSLTPDGLKHLTSHLFYENKADRSLSLKCKIQ